MPVISLYLPHPRHPPLCKHAVSLFCVFLFVFFLFLISFILRCNIYHSTLVYTNDQINTFFIPMIIISILSGYSKLAVEDFRIAGGGA